MAVVTNGLCSQTLLRILQFRKCSCIRNRLRASRLVALQRQVSVLVNVGKLPSISVVIFARHQA